MSANISASGIVHFDRLSCSIEGNGLGIKRHGGRGYIGTDSNGRFVSGTKSKTLVGAWIAVILTPLMGFGIVTSGTLVTFLGMVGTMLGPLTVMVLASAASLWAIVTMWMSRLWRGLSLAITTLISWILWEVAFGVLEWGVYDMPTLSGFLGQ